MKKFLSALAIAVIAWSCGQNKTATEEKKEDSTAKPKVAEVKINYPYKAGYSSSFEFGKPENAKLVLDIWKAFEDNKLDDTKGMWSDSVSMQFDGFTFHGKPDSAIYYAKQERNLYTSVVDSVDAWMSLHSTDRNEDWVALWAREYRVDKKGKKDLVNLHEIWLIKNGKAAYVAQFKAHHKP